MIGYNYVRFFERNLLCAVLCKSSVGSSILQVFGNLICSKKYIILLNNTYIDIKVVLDKKTIRYFKLRKY